MTWSADDHRHMQRALELAARGAGYVEPNPMVGCVIVREGRVVGEGWHQKFGGPHAEIEALRVAGDETRGATLYVSLEPCCHVGKTPACTEAVLAAGISRVIVAEQDPFPLVDGGGIQRLREVGIQVDVGLMAGEAHDLNSPFRKQVTTGRPWVIAKWAMSLDGKIATRTGESQWISNERSRAVVHQLRGRVDAVIVGRGTAAADNPLLTARPPGPRIATRLVLDSQGRLSSSSRLVQSARETPVLIAAGQEIEPRDRQRLQDAGCEVLVLSGDSWAERWPILLQQLGQRRFTNVLVEGGATTLGGLFEMRLVDEVHVFISPKIIGGSSSPGPVAGSGVDRLIESIAVSSGKWEQLDGDLYFRGRT